MNLETLARAVAHVAGTEGYSIQVSTFVSKNLTQHYRLVRAVHKHETYAYISAEGDTVALADTKVATKCREYIKECRKPYDAELDKILGEL